MSLLTYTAHEVELDLAARPTREVFLAESDARLASLARLNRARNNIRAALAQLDAS